MRRARGCCRIAAKTPSSLFPGRVVASVIVPGPRGDSRKASMGIGDSGVIKLLTNRGGSGTESVSDSFAPLARSVQHFAHDFEQVGRDAGKLLNRLEFGT